MSCERLRALLPQFDGRREDMASVLEMTVYFLQLAHSMAPGWEQLSVSCKQVSLVSVSTTWCPCSGATFSLPPWARPSAQSGHMCCTPRIHPDHTS